MRDGGRTELRQGPADEIGPFLLYRKLLPLFEF